MSLSSQNLEIAESGTIDRRELRRESQRRRRARIRLEKKDEVPELNRIRHQTASSTPIINPPYTFPRRDLYSFDPRKHIVSSFNETIGKSMPILRPQSFVNDGRPIGTAHRFPIAPPVYRSSHNQTFDEGAGPSSLNTNAQRVDQHRPVWAPSSNDNALNDEVYKTIKEIELEEYRRRKDMVNDLAKLCKTIPLTVTMVNPLLINFNGWPNNIIKK